MWWSRGGLDELHRNDSGAVVASVASAATFAAFCSAATTPSSTSAAFVVSVLRTNVSSLVPY